MKDRKFLVIFSVLITCVSLISANLAEAQQEPLFTLHMILPNDQPYIDICTVFKEEAAKIGINIELEVMDYASYFDRYEEKVRTFEEGGYDLEIFNYGWFMTDYIWYIGCYHHTGIVPLGWECYFWNDAIADDYLWGVMTTYNQTKRIELMRKWQEEFYRNPPQALLFWPMKALMTGADIEGYDPILWNYNAHEWRVKGKTEEDDVSIIFAVTADTRMLNPLFLDGGYAHLDPQFRTLYQIKKQPDGTYLPVPDMAESCEISEDGLSATIKLRRDIVWHDGEPFTSPDVKFSYDTMMNSETGSSYGGELSAAITSVETPDEYTVVLHLAEPQPAILSIISCYGAAIIPKHVLEDVPPAELRNHITNTENPAPGTGPYKFVKWVKDQYMELEAFDDFYEGRPFVDHIFIQVIPDALTALSSLETHEVDILDDAYTDALVAEIPRVMEKTDLHIEKMPYPSHWEIGFNMLHPVLNNRYVRLALCHVVPYEHIVNDIMKGFGKRANTVPNDFTFGWNPDVPLYDYNLEKASEYLRKAGYIWPRSEAKIPMEVYLLPSVGAFAVGVVVTALVTYFVIKRRKPE